MINNWSQFTESQLEQHSFWVLSLSDDTMVIQDDILTNENGYFEVRDYCHKNGLFVKEAILRFRSHFELAWSSSDEDGFYFSKALRHFIVQEKDCHMYNVGSVCGNKITRKKWWVPELIFEESDSVDLSNVDERCIIWTPNKLPEKYRQK